MQHGALERADDGTLRVADGSLIGELYHLFRCFGEAYLLVLGSVDRLAKPQDAKAFAKSLQDDGDRLISGEIISRMSSAY